MKITLYFINFNDSFYLKFIKQHYGKFCQRIVMYDNHSTDDSVAMATLLGFEVRMFGLPGELNDQRYLDVKNHCWKESRGEADYVIVCDADEFVTPPVFKSGSLPVVEGFNMIDEALPMHSFSEIASGVPSKNYSKQAIFDPTGVEEISFLHGCHSHQVKGNVNFRENPTFENGKAHIHYTAKLYHYRMIGGVQRMIDRHKMYEKRMCQFNRENGLGIHYLYSEESKKIEWEQMKKEAYQVRF